MHSPALNQNLLQRSEVVALINTLNRFVESLAAVNDFRKLWAEADSQEEERLIEEAVSSARSAQNVRAERPMVYLRHWLTPLHLQPRKSPAAGTDSMPENFLQDLLDRVACWVRACRDGTIGCVHGLLDGLRSVLDAVTSAFKLSGKDQAPRSEL